MNENIPGSFSYYDVITGDYTFTGLPASGSISLFAIFASAGTGTNTLPGNYWFQTSLYDCSTLPTTTAYDLHAWEILHLLAPQDNAAVDPSITALASQASPLVFSWEAPIPGAVYKYSVEYYKDSPFKYVGIAIPTTSTTDTQVSLNLPVSAAGEHYQFYLDAYDSAGNQVGEFRRTSSGGYSWDYRFKISQSRDFATPPSFSPAAGSFPAGAPVKVSLSSATAGATIRYTLDGTPPTENSTPYSAAAGIPLSGAATIRAAAFPADTTVARSDIASASYSFVSSGKSLSGKVSFNGADINTVTSVAPMIYAYDSVSYASVKNLATYFDAASSTYYVANMPASGSYVLVVKFGHNLLLGGEFSASDTIAEIASASSPYSLAAIQAIVMTSPRPNSSAFSYTYSSSGPADIDAYQGSPTISWTAVPGAVKYRYYLSVALDGGTSSTNYGTTTVDEVTTSVLTALPASDATHHYQLWGFNAYSDAACANLIGTYYNTTTTTFGSTLNFKVE